MREQFTTKEIALALKELGFDEECAGWIDEDGNISVWIRTVTNSQCHGNNCALPLWQQAWSFLLNKLENKYPLISMQLFCDTSGTVEYKTGIIGFDSQKEGVLKAIELCKQK